MDDRIRGLRLRRCSSLLLAALVASALGACGSSSGDATTLLAQTFGGSHKVNSGNLSFNLTVNPSGSSTLSGPITVSFGGPFQSLGIGRLPESNFNVSVSALGHTGSLGLVSTGTTGYVTLQGTSYQLPTATFRKLESSFASLASSSNRGSGSGALAKLGIDPRRWLSNPTIVGSDTIGGVDTTHIRAGVNVAALLADLNTFLAKASSSGISGASRIPSSISPATASRIAGEVKSPTVDVWTGKSDKTVRKLTIGLTLPVSGQISTLLGGLRSAQIGLSMQYADLNKPQTIVAPASIRPFSEFTTKIRAFVQALSGTFGSGSSGPTTASPTPGSVASYSHCVQVAGSDATKRQRCASLLTPK